MLRDSETRLIACGHTDVESRLHILSGIYYGTEWSRDFEVERSTVRNLGFQTYLSRPYSNFDDPRPCIGCGLFLSVRGSQDVGGVDMGHLLIGLNARTRFLSRDVDVPFHGATGLELTTWVGDLGGATARLAIDRLTEPRVSATRYFRGTDYGASSNLEGDVAAYVIAASSSTEPTAPNIPDGETIADALDRYFVGRLGYRERRRQFLTLQGGQFTDGALNNRSAVESRLAGKLESFGRVYAANFLRSRNRMNLRLWLSVENNLSGAAADVAARFVDYLLARTG